MTDNFTQATVTPPLPAWLFNEEELALLYATCGVNCESHGDSLYFFAETSFAEWGETAESESLDCLALFHEKLLQLDADEYPRIVIEGAATCSKMCPGEFGGFAYVIERDGVHSFSTSEWIDERTLEPVHRPTDQHANN